MRLVLSGPAIERISLKPSVGVNQIQCSWVRNYVDFFFVIKISFRFSPGVIPAYVINVWPFYSESVWTTQWILFWTIFFIFGSHPQEFFPLCIPKRNPISTEVIMALLAVPSFLWFFCYFILRCILKYLCFHIQPKLLPIAVSQTSVQE